jgi:hypothetical protein
MSDTKQLEVTQAGNLPGASALRKMGSEEGDPGF